MVVNLQKWEKSLRSHGGRISPRCVRVEEQLSYQGLHSFHPRLMLGAEDQEIVFHPREGYILNRPMSPNKARQALDVR